MVSIYTNNRYQSFDLDFVSLADRAKIKRAMESLGFIQKAGRHFVHPGSKFFVEFPGSAILVGNSPVTEFQELSVGGNTLKLLTPTDCVKDRLAAFYHWYDRQGLDQAVWVATAQPIKLAEIEKWSVAENKFKEFEEFRRALQAASQT